MHKMIVRMALYKVSLDWDAVEYYFSLFGFSTLFEELKRRYRHAQ